MIGHFNKEHLKWVGGTPCYPAVQSARPEAQLGGRPDDLVILWSHGCVVYTKTNQCTQTSGIRTRGKWGVGIVFIFP